MILSTAFLKRRSFIGVYQEFYVKNSEKLLWKNLNESEWSLIISSSLLAVFLHCNFKNFR